MNNTDAFVTQGITRLLRDESLSLSSDERREVEEFLAANELGLALETLCYILIEERKEPGASHREDIARLATTMGLSGEIIDAVIAGM